MARPTESLFIIATGGAVALDDATALIAAATEHRLGGVVSSAVREGRVEIGAEWLRVLAAEELEVRRQHRVLWERLDHAMIAAGTVGVSPISIKGITLEHRWYSRMGERACLDIDLVVPPHQLHLVEQLLAVWGVEPQRRRQVQRLVDRRLLQSVELQFEGGMIDLHFDLLKLGPWVRSELIVVDAMTDLVGAPGRAVVVSPALELVALATHLNKDRLRSLGAYVDIARVGSDPSLDWDAVHRFVAAEGLAVPVYRTLGAVASLFNKDWPLPVPTGMRARMWDRLWPSESRLTGSEGRRRGQRRQWWLPFLLEGRRREAVADLRRRAFPPQELLDVQEVDRIAGSSGRGLERLRRVATRRYA